MKNLATILISISMIAIASASFINNASAQCAVSGTPSYSSSCTAEYFTAISASGTGVVSTIGLTGGSCTGITFFNDYTSQGVTVAAGNTVNLHITRYTTTYTGYLSVYVDWNNDGTYAPSELAGTMITMPSSLLTTTYSFTVPTTGIVTGVNLHMRVFLTELAGGAPCSANFGQTYDYYLFANCPVTAISVTPPSGSVCVGGTGISLTASGAGTGGIYSWAPSTGLSATTGATITAAPGATTVYTVTGTTSIGCRDSATVAVATNPSPSAVAGLSGAPSICNGDSVTLRVVTSPGNSYQWYNVTSVLSGATDSAYTDTAAGSFYAIVTNAYGCTATSDTLVITVNAPVPVFITSSGDTTFCNGDSVKLYVSHGAGYAYQWDKNGMVIAGATDSTYTALTAGSYNCNISIPGICTIATASKIITVHPTPVPVITLSGKTLHTASTYVTYQWYENGTLITGAVHDSDIVHSNGAYTVKVTDANGCIGTSTAFPVAHVAVQNITNTSTISIYPNPATNIINIEAPVAVNVVITNPSGKVSLRQNASRSMDISSLPAGSYVIELFDEKQEQAAGTKTG